MMLILDTNVVSESMRRAGDEKVLGWLNRQPESDLYLTAVTAAELMYGVLRLPAGRRRVDLQTEVGVVGDQDFPRRTLPSALAAAKACAAIRAQRERAGRPVGIDDAQIAGICVSRAVTLATRNTKDFEGTGVDLVNPWEEG